MQTAQPEMICHFYTVGEAANKLVHQHLMHIMLSEEQISFLKFNKIWAMKEGEKNLALETIKTYKITFSDLISKCDAMQKWRGKQIDRNKTTSIYSETFAFFKKQSIHRASVSVCAVDCVKNNHY